MRYTKNRYPNWDGPELGRLYHVNDSERNAKYDKIKKERTSDARAARLRKVIEELALSQNLLAGMLRITGAQVMGMVNNETPIHFHHAAAIYYYTEINPDWLMLGDSEPKYLADDSPSLTDDERLLIQRVRSLKKRHETSYLDYLDFLEQKNDGHFSQRSSS